MSLLMCTICEVELSPSMEAGNCVCLNAMCQSNKITFNPTLLLIRDKLAEFELMHFLSNTQVQSEKKAGPVHQDTRIVNAEAEKNDSDDDIADVEIIRACLCVESGDTRNLLSIIPMRTLA